MNWLKFLPYLVAVVAGFGLAIGVTKYTQPVLTCPTPTPCPACNCPATVSLMNFDLDKLNNKRGTFNYSPQLHDVKIVIENKDSLLLKQILKEAK